MLDMDDAYMAFITAMLWCYAKSQQPCTPFSLGGGAGTGMKLHSLYEASAVRMHAILESFPPVSPHNKNFCTFYRLIGHSGLLTPTTTCPEAKTSWEIS